MTVKTGWIVIAVVFATVLWLSLRFRQGRNFSPMMQSKNQQADPKSVYLGLRNLALQDSQVRVDANPVKPTEPFAVLMDWGIDAGTATVAAFADGTASVYLSNGGGFIGGGQSHESIRHAARKTIEIAGELQPLMQPTSTYPLPERGRVTFYVCTDAGVFTASASEDDMRSHRSPLSKLGDSAQTIITEYRQIQSR